MRHPDYQAHCLLMPLTDRFGMTSSEVRDWGIFCYAQFIDSLELQGPAKLLSRSNNLRAITLRLYKKPASSAGLDAERGTAPYLLPRLPSPPFSKRRPASLAFVWYRIRPAYSITLPGVGR